MVERISGWANPMTAEARRTYGDDIAQRDRLVFEAFAAGYIGEHVLGSIQRRFALNKKERKKYKESFENGALARAKHERLVGLIYLINDTNPSKLPDEVMELIEQRVGEE